ncbi:MAG: hypothetical protein P1V97_26575 [Planctomycetota bacterium]|nr:hypothetical protein [Planctomycetota bacterium]
MIEINLLPEEFQRSEGTPVPMVLTIVIGVIVVGSLSAFLFKSIDSRRNLSQSKDKKVADRDKWRKQAAKLDGIVKEINQMKKREETIIDMSRSKIFWSQKLFQFSEIKARFKRFWVESITMSQEGLSGRLTMNCFAFDSTRADIGKFRTALTTDTTFFYHFKSATMTRVTLVKGGENGQDKLQFQITLELKDGPESKKKKRRR